MDLAGSDGDAYDCDLLIAGSGAAGLTAAITAHALGLRPMVIEKSPWVMGDADRLIKIAMYGLMGPIEVNGKKYDGQVPMTPFGGMLNDAEVAAVLTYVRNSFGNAAAPIQPEEVQKIRAQQPGRMMLYNAEELLKEHPMK